MRKIGITTTIPSEIIFAAGAIPVDLNNIFITHPNKSELIRKAEVDGIPRNFCAWTKGIYGACIEEAIKEVVIVVQGDCSSTVVLCDYFQANGITVIPFAYPYDGDRKDLFAAMEKLIHYFNTSWDAAEEIKLQLGVIREKIWQIDKLTFQKNVVTGFENHYFQVSSSDMEGSLENFSKVVDKFLIEVETRPPFEESSRLAYIGVPPIIEDLYDFIEGVGGRVVFNEMQRQFSMPYPSKDLVEQYSLYTYPYSLFKKVEDINQEIKKRNIDGVIHYVQSFCHHQAESMLYKKNIKKPFLVLECDYPGRIDARSRMRVESFIAMLRDAKK